MWDNTNSDWEKTPPVISFDEIELFHDDVLDEKIRNKKEVGKVLWLHHEGNTRILHPHDGRVIDDYPHIARMIDKLIPFPDELLIYIKDLLNPDYNPERNNLSQLAWKPKERLWFPPSMLSELHKVLEITEKRVEESNRKKWIVKKLDIWTALNTWNKVR